MGIFDFFKISKVDNAPKQETVKKQQSQAYITDGRYSMPFDGEKDFGEVGPALDYLPNFQVLSLRSWQMFMDSDIARTVLEKYVLWIMGNGLRLQMEPITSV